MNKMLSTKWKIIILIMLIIGVGIFALISQYKWSNQLVRAVLYRDENKVALLLKDKTKNPNFLGRGLESHTRPITRTCLDPTESAMKMLKMLIDAGARVEQEDYYCELDGVNKYSLKKLRLMLDTGVKPVISSDAKYGNLLEVTAYTDTSYYDVYDMKQEEWENLILEIYKLVYNNAEPFDQKKELKNSLDEAKKKNNKPLIEFIESELANLE